MPIFLVIVIVIVNYPTLLVISYLEFTERLVFLPNELLPIMKSA